MGVVNTIAPAVTATATQLTGVVGAENSGIDLTETPNEHNDRAPQ